ncbi:MAG: GNAT family N-acetyltransferase [Elusimicrobiota bacterium]|jgi:predicted acetyltransferase|nr:GNAT family N-acetyltransferase [Elusimicrobiota bacterium]
MKITELSDSRKKEIYQLYAESFNDAQPWTNFFFEILVYKMRAFGVLDGKKLISMLYATPKKLIFGGREVYSQLLLSVCTAKEYRRQGHMNRLLEYVQRVFKQERYELLFLCPINYDYYKKSGFCPMVYQENITIEYDGIGKHTVRKAQTNDAALLLSIYEQYTAAKNAYALRDLDYFDVLLANTNTLIIYNEDEAAGYISYDGYYFEVCADQELLSSVEALDGRSVDISAASGQIIQAAYILNPSTFDKRDLENPLNVNFDRYY